MSSGKSKFYKRINILARDKFFNAFFKKHPKHKELGRNHVKELAYDFFQVAGDLLVNQPNGIVLDGIGYFSNVVFDNRKIVTDYYETQINLTTNGRIYKSHMFPTIFRNIHLEHWSFRICKKRRAEMAKKIKSGMKYLCHYSLLKKQKNYGRSYFLRSVHK